MRRQQQRLKISYIYYIKKHDLFDYTDGIVMIFLFHPNRRRRQQQQRKLFNLTAKSTHWESKAHTHTHMQSYRTQKKCDEIKVTRYARETHTNMRKKRDAAEV